MCTAALLPTSDGGYILANNRDERHTRGLSLPPTRHTSAERVFLAPTDSDAGGTWISVNTAGVTICLLNNYQAQALTSPREPILSRGHVVRRLAGLDALERIEGALRDVSQFPLAHIRPFVVLAIVPGSQGAPVQALRAVWDAKELRIAPWPLPEVEVSHILYDEVHGIRSQAVQPLLFTHDAPPSPREVLRTFAQHTPQRGASSICMHSDVSRTVSHTQVHVHSNQVYMMHAQGSPCTAPHLERYTFEGEV